MSQLSPEFVLKRSGQSISDLNFWVNKSSAVLLASHSGNAGIDLWDLKTRRSKMNIPSDTSMLSACSFKSDQLVSLDKEGNLKLIDVAGGTPQTILQLFVPEVAFCKAAVIENNEEPSEHHPFVAVPGDAKSSINIWDLPKATLLKRLIPPDSMNLGMPWGVKLFYSERLYAIVSYENGSMLCWDVMENKIFSNSLSFFNEPVMCFDACKDPGNTKCFLGVSGSVTDEFIKWKTDCCKGFSDSENDIDDATLNNQNCRKFSVLKRHKLLNPGLSCIKIRPDLKIIATGGWDYKIRIFSWKNTKPLAVLDYHTNTVQAMSFATYSSEKLLACGSVDSKISIWNLYS